jgi:hypothetical protein
MQHIVKPTAIEKIPDAILVTDLDITKFVAFLMIDIQYDIHSDQISYRLPDTDITEVLVLEERMWQTAISKMYNRLSGTSQTEIKFTVHPYFTSFRNDLQENLFGMGTPAALDCEGPLTTLDKIPPIEIGDAVSDLDPIPKLNTSDTTRTLDVEQQNLLAHEPSPRSIKGWRWALVVFAILSSLFVYVLGIFASVFLILLSLGLRRERLFMAVGGVA